MRCKLSHFPAKSGIKVSRVVLGELLLMLSQFAPRLLNLHPSNRHGQPRSRQHVYFHRFTLSATRSGSFKSTAFGRPVLTAQKPQDLVQIFPKIIKVAVPSPQHSPMFGQLPLSQIVKLVLINKPSHLLVAFTGGQFNP